MDELAHQIKHAAQQQSQEHRPFVYAHIASYDPKLHRVRCIIPSMRDEASNYVLTSWMPLESSWVGPSWGIQIAPLGGATQENPTMGEMVQLQLIERQYGVMTVASMFFNQTNQPPFPTLQPGEMGMKHKSGSLLQFTNDGNVAVMSAQDVVVNAGRDANVTTVRNAAINATGDASIVATGNASVQGINVKITGSSSIEFDAPSIKGGGASGLLQLINSAFEALFNAHTHPAPGGNTGAPTVPMDSSMLTQTFEAK
jgi:hypothetical protein